MHFEELSLRHQTFLSEYVQNGFNASKAYRDVYLTEDEGVSRACASRLLTNENIQKALAELVNKITPEYVLSLISSIAMDGKRDSDRLRAMELLGKYHALFKDTTQNLNIHAITSDDLEGLRKRLEDKKPIDANVTLKPQEPQPIEIKEVTK